MGRQIQLLLDTHALFWWLLDDLRLSRDAHAAIADGTNRVFVSPVSALELAIKYRLGKLPGGERVIPGYDNLLAAEGFVVLPLTGHHALNAGLYPGEHRDPFDRLLAAQAELDELTLVTRDPAFAHFPCRTLW